MGFNLVTAEPLQRRAMPDKEELVKPGVSMLVWGVILAAIGAVAWQVNLVNLFHPGSTEAMEMIVNSREWVKLVGIALLVIGCGLALGGVVRMIVKRSTE